MSINNKKEGLIYDIYGILNDYLIDTNQYMAMNGPIYNYENFQNWEKWEAAKIEIGNQDFLILDIDLNKFSYCKYIRHEKTVLKSGLNSKNAIKELKSLSISLGIDILDQMEFYLKRKTRTINSSTICENVFTINKYKKDLMICKIVQEGREDTLSLVRDVFGNGWLDEHEIRLDENYYNEEEGEKRLKVLSKKLGLNYIILLSKTKLIFIT